MKLVIAILESENVNKVVRALMEEDIRATKLSSTGGFLKSGNTTLLIGVKKEDKDKVVEIIKANTGRKKVNSHHGDVEVGGANLFIIDMDKYLRI